MSVVNLFRTAAALPDAWRSRALGEVGTACVKVLRMDDTSHTGPSDPSGPGDHDDHADQVGGLVVEEEVHGTPEALLVLDGRLQLRVEDVDLSLGPGEMYVVRAGARHAVRAGSRGTLLIVEVPEG